MAYFGSMLLDTKSKIPLLILCLVLIICSPLHVMSRYGNQELDYISPAQLSGMVFFHDRVTEGFVAGTFPIGQMRNLDQYRRFSFEWISLEKGKLVFSNRPLDWPRYISISRQEKIGSEFQRGDTTFYTNIEGWLYSATNCNSIYANTDINLYTFEDLFRKGK